LKKILSKKETGNKNGILKKLVTMQIEKNENNSNEKTSILDKVRSEKKEFEEATKVKPSV